MSAEVGGSRDEAWLAVDGAELRDGAGRRVVLRGAAVGGWLNMENFITGYPSTESLQREALRRRLGAERAERLLGSLLDHFFTGADARFLASLGMNSVRIPLSYHHLEDDGAPRRIRPEGFARLDRAVAACAAEGLYVIVDLHALPGAQNHHWHSDNRFHAPGLWRHRDFQDRTVAIWEAIAEHYRDQPWVAGYNLINEPADEEGEHLVALYRRLVAAVRAVDPRHALFLEGNRYAQDFEGFPEPFENTVYAIHQYPLPGSADGEAYPGPTAGAHYDAAAVAEQYRARTRYMRHHGVPVWVGEFGPVYSGDPVLDAGRRRLLQDQLDLYEAEGAHWSLWTYKDVGVQGLVRARAGSPYLRRIAGVRAKKARLGADSWGMTGAGVEPLVGPLVELVGREFPDYDPYPFGARKQVELLVRHILLAEPLADDFGRAFEGASDEELDQMGASFALESCERDEPLCQLLSATIARLARTGSAG